MRRGNKLIGVPMIKNNKKNYPSSYGYVSQRYKPIPSFEKKEISDVWYVIIPIIIGVSLVIWMWSIAPT